MDVEYEWDDAKNAFNRLKHQITFEAAILIWDGFVFEFLDNRLDYGEERLIAVGVVEGRHLTVVYTWRNGARRIISARRADRNEQRSYHQALARRDGFGSD